MTETAVNPPKPRLVLRVGITGKRQLAVSGHRPIREELAKVFDLLAQGLTDIWEKNRAVFAPETPVLRIICGMAEGADQLVAQVAVDRAKRALSPSSKIETRLAAILPFPREEFIKDFERDPNREEGNDLRTPDELKEAVDRFDGLLDDARKEALLELDDEALRTTGEPAQRDLAYVGLRDLLVQHSDVVIAIFDETQERKPGGSADVTHLAAHEAVPVIRISTAGKPVCLLRAAEPDDPDQRPKGEGVPLDLNGSPPLAQLLTAILAPPRDASGEHELQETHGGHKLRSGRERLEHYLGENGVPASFAWLFKACRNVLLKWAGAEEAASTSGPKEVWPESGPLTAPYSTDTKFRDILRRRFVAADAIAISYADSTRSSYIAIAFYGAAAVVVGLLAVLFWGKYAGLVKAILLCTEGWILWRLAVNYYRPAHDGSWHERMVEYRVLAELLRHQRAIYALGGASRAERTGDRSWRGPDAWLGWYVQATTRELGFPTARLSADYRRAALAAFHQDEVREQIDYNDRERTRSKVIDGTLGWMIENAWRATVFVAFAGALVVLVLWALKLRAGANSSPEWWLDHAAKPVLTIFMAFVPALIAAIHGIRFQMEFANASKRAETTFKELGVIDEKVQDMLASTADPGRKSLELIVRSANDALVADLSGWSTVYKHKAAELA
jgi:hypothetical protein